MEIVDKDFKVSYVSGLQCAVKRTLTKENLLETLCIGICEELFAIQGKFWEELRYLEKQQE